VAIVALTVEQVIRAGLAATYNGSLDTADTYQFANDGKVVLHAIKGGAGDAELTFGAPGLFYGMTFMEHVATVPASTGNLFLGPFPPQIFNDTAGLVSFTTSNVAGLTIAVLHLA
jgi:hypothetical protein